MHHLCVKLADLRIRIAHRHPDLAAALAPYRAARGSTDFCAAATKRAMREIARRSSFRPTPGYAESLVVFEEICEQMPLHDGIMLHAACIAAEGRAYAFLAPSGTGKTTHMMLWMDALAARAVIINGDKPFVRFVGGAPHAYGNPWAGKEGFHQNIRAPLAALCFIERGQGNSIRRLNAREVLPRLIQQVYMPRREQPLDHTLALVDRLARSVDAYALRCTASREAAQLAMDRMMNRDRAAEYARAQGG
ncbi:MAG: hypothetical protein ACOYI5_06185 [Christensenellales bacterium]|jgi:hypothetical protein